MAYTKKQLKAMLIDLLVEHQEDRKKHIKDSELLDEAYKQFRSDNAEIGRQATLIERLKMDLFGQVNLERERSAEKDAELARLRDRVVEMKRVLQHSDDTYQKQQVIIANLQEREQALKDRCAELEDAVDKLGGLAK